MPSDSRRDPGAAHRSKIDRVCEDESRTPHVWSNTFARETTTGPNRLAIGPRDDPIGTLIALAPAIGPEHWLLYVLLTPRGSAPEGRYESPPLPTVDVELFLREFERALRHDSRHELWIGSTSGPGLLVYDSHDRIFAYGPLDEFERRLRRLGFAHGESEVDFPHVHHFLPEYDEQADRILERWEWHRSDLQPSDG